MYELTGVPKGWTFLEQQIFEGSLMSHFTPPTHTRSFFPSFSTLVPSCTRALTLHQPLAEGAEGAAGNARNAQMDGWIAFLLHRPWDFFKGHGWEQTLRNLKKTKAGPPLSCYSVGVRTAVFYWTEVTTQGPLTPPHTHWYPSTPPFLPHNLLIGFSVHTGPDFFWDAFCGEGTSVLYLSWFRMCSVKVLFCLFVYCAYILSLLCVVMSRVARFEWLTPQQGKKQNKTKQTHCFSFCPHLDTPCAFSPRLSKLHLYYQVTFFGRRGRKKIT